MKKTLVDLFPYLYKKKVFTLLITGFVLSAFASWAYLTSAIQDNIDYRLENELNRINAAINSNVHNYANTLAYVHAYFKTQGLPERLNFRRLAENIRVQQAHHGIQALGYITVVKRNQLKSFVLQHRNIPFFTTDSLIVGREVYAPLTMIEPLDALKLQNLGADMLLEKARGDAILEAISSAGMTLSKPTLNFEIQKSGPQQALFLLLPFYKTPNVPEDQERRYEQAHGLIFIPIRMRDFFESVLSKPNISNERVNFDINYLDETLKSEIPLYRRFDTSTDKDALSKSRVLDIYGQKWKLTVTTFPQFFYFGDRYLANTVALTFILFVGLLLSLFKQTQNLLKHEMKTKELMELTIVHSREYAGKLKRLNDMNSQTDLKLDLNHIVKDFFNASLPVSQSSHAFLYCSLLLDSQESVSLYEARGFQPSDLKVQSRSITQLNEMMAENLVLKKDRLSQPLYSEFIRKPDEFSDWILIAIPSREFRRCGLLFLAREKGASFSDIDIEIIESMVTQLGVRIDNSRLFKKVEDSNKVKTAFLSNMSHEIRTPLNAIAGYSEILEQSHSVSQKHALIEGIKKNTTQLTSIIDNILDISKIEFGRIFIHKKIFSLSYLMKGIESDLESRARDKGLSFKIESIGSLPTFIESDESRIKQILFNLIGNAIKFTERGSVVIKIKCDTSHTTNPCLVFNIIDTGMGIPVLRQTELFQSFTQVDDSMTRKFGGIGLGLALSKRLAQQIGGEVSLLGSQPSLGSTFQLKVPCGNLIGAKWIKNIFDDLISTIPTIDHVKTKLNHNELKNKKVLIVEDSPDNQEIFKFFLTSAGAISDVIDNGEDAVNYARTSNYDFILMDIQLPKMDGLEATRQIRLAGYKKPIIALTAHASAEEKLSCLKAGCIDLITKPVTQVNLIQKIQTIIEENP